MKNNEITDSKNFRKSLFLPQLSQNNQKEDIPNFAKSPKTKLGIGMISPSKNLICTSPSYKIRNFEENSFKSIKTEADNKPDKLSKQQKKVQKNQSKKVKDDFQQKMYQRYRLCNSIHLKRQQLTQRINPQKLRQRQIQKPIFVQPELKKARSISILQQYQQQKTKIDKSYKMKTTSQLIDQIQELKIEKSSLEQYQAQYQKNKQAEIKQLKNKIETLNVEKQNYEAQQHQKDICKQQRQDQLRQLQKQVSRSLQYIQKIQQENKNYLEAIEHLKNENISFVTVIQKMSGQLAHTQQNLNAQRNNSIFFKQTIAVLQAKHKQYQKQHENYQTQIKRLHDIINKSQNQSQRLLKKSRQSQVKRQNNLSQIIKIELNNKPKFISVKKIQYQQTDSKYQEKNYLDREFKSQMRSYFEQIMKKLSQMHQTKQKARNQANKVSCISIQSQQSQGFQECFDFTNVQIQRFQMLAKKY